MNRPGFFEEEVVLPPNLMAEPDELIHQITEYANVIDENLDYFEQQDECYQCAEHIRNLARCLKVSLDVENSEVPETVGGSD